MTESKAWIIPSLSQIQVDREILNREIDFFQKSDKTQENIGKQCN